MKWGIFSVTFVVILLIIFWGWPRIKDYPKKDRIAFMTLLCIGGILSLFDLPNIPGPVTLLETFFKPFHVILK